MADLATTIHETIERHRYAVPAGEMSYRPGDPICSCGWRPPKPNGELHSRHVATEVARAVLAWSAGHHPRGPRRLRPVDPGGRS